MDGFASFIDSRKIDTNSEITADLCIIGAGAAGITLAREVAGYDVRVALLETGGLNYEEDIQRLGTIQNAGRYYDVKGCRLRYFGGTTNHWGGHCARLEEIDFEVRDWIPDSGWPFGLDHLRPYYDRAHDVVEIGGNSYDPALIAQKLGFKLFPFTGEKAVTTLSRYNRQRFGVRFARELDKATNVTVYLYATVASIELDGNHRRASHVVVKTPAGNEIRVRATQFVVATGGIENARLLLDSDRQQSNGIGNQNGLVGRYFNDHIWYPSGFIQPGALDPAYGIYTREISYEDKAPLRVRCHVALSQDMTRKLRIPKFRAEIGTWSDLSASLGLLKSGRITADDVLNLLGHPLAAWQYLSSGKSPEHNAYGLRNYVEQAPNPESRITLSNDRNALGQRLARLDWRLSEIDRRGVRLAHETIAQEVGRHRFGRFRITLPDQDRESVILENAGGGSHHIGTTRMHVDPKRGVVDPTCRLHDHDNIYMAGSSVFPCSGWPNPTLTIVALALRLADHLKRTGFRHG